MAERTIEPIPDSFENVVDSVMQPKIKTTVRRCNGICVTDHALLRWFERTNTRWARDQKVLRMVAFGKEVFPKRRLAKLLNNNCKEANYYEYGGMVAVLVDKVVVTVLKYEPEKWRDANA